MTSETNVIPPPSDDCAEWKTREEAFWNDDYLRTMVLPALGLKAGATVLDVGCGQGGLILEIARLYPGADCVGADFDERLLEDARRRIKDERLANVRVQLGDALKLAEFEDAAFDVVCCQTLLANVPDPDLAVRQMARVLKRGGVFLAVEQWDPGVRALLNNVTTPHRDERWHSEFFRLFRLRNEGRKKRGDGDDQAGLRVAFMASAAGLEVIDVRLNDHVSFAFEGKNEGERGYLKFFQCYLHRRFGQARTTSPDANILAAGGSESDARRYSDTYPNSAQEAVNLWKTLQADEYQVVFAKFTFLTFARKPR